MDVLPPASAPAPGGQEGTFTSTRNTLAALASKLASSPLPSFAAGPQSNAPVHAQAGAALAHIFAHAVQSEPGAGPHIIPFLHSIHPEPAPGSAGAGTPASRKRKRGGKKGAAGPDGPPPTKHSLFTSTPLDTLVLDGMDPDQLWAQLELRAQPIQKMINALIVTEQLDEDEQDAEDAEGAADDEGEAAWSTEDEDEAEDEAEDDSSNDSSDVELEPDGLLDLVDPEEEYDDSEDDDHVDSESDEQEGSTSIRSIRSGQENQDPNSSRLTNGTPRRSSPPSERTTPIRVRFREQVAVRHIQPRKVRDDEDEDEDSDDDDDDDEEDDEDSTGNPLTLSPQLIQALAEGKLTEADLVALRRGQLPASTLAARMSAGKSSGAGAEHDEDDDDDDEEDDEFDMEDENDEDEENSAPKSAAAAAAAKARKASNTPGIAAEDDTDGDDTDDDELDDDEDADFGIDLFQDVLNDDAGADADEAEDGVGAAADAHYADFFGNRPPPDMKGALRKGKGAMKIKKPAKRPRLDAGGKEEEDGGTAEAGLGFPEEDDLDADLDEDEDDFGEGQDEEEEEDAEMEFDDEGTAKRVANDLFADDDDEQKGPEQLSRFEKRQAALREEIAALERENVSKKDWTMRGEIGAPARPVNSLLEEDLEFAQSMKRAPIITEQSTQTLEDRIKARILEGRFDDVERRYASLERDAFVPSRMLELSDAKSGKSLADLYEDEYQAQGQGEGSSSAAGGSRSAGGSEADRKLEAEHQAITGLFDEVFGKLDALSNAHYTPKAPKATIQTLTNAPAITLESALPTHAASAASTMLAPEEVFEPARGSSSNALVGARSEMTPEEKQALHERLRREKKKRNERIGKVQSERERAAAAGPGGSGSAAAAKGKKGEKEAKEAALKKLIGNKGVSVIGKDGKNRTGKDALGSSNISNGKKAKKGGASSGSKDTDDASARSGTKLKL
ncbi:U3 snoRNP protein [Tilletia horrida]|uniref:U3 snoRNP protein n=1 Tax=Tilletia horrida TaxID=155126 RepID=A0AAN6G558_9BASI|nr:U3 snoRNP protein [Tilletia horrida]